MSSMRYNSSAYNDVINQIDNVKRVIDDAEGKLQTFVSQADCTGWENTARRKSTKRVLDDKGTKKEKDDEYVLYVDEHEEKTWLSELDSYKKYKDNFSRRSAYLSFIENKLDILMTGLKTINDEVRKFEEDNKVVDIEAIMDHLINTNQIVSSQFNIEDFDVQQVNGTNVIMYKMGDEWVSISDMLNAFYTYTGMSMSANIEGRLLAEKMGVEFDEDYQMKIMNGVNTVIEDSFSNGLFGIADENAINAAAGSLGITLDENNDFNSIINNYGSNFDMSGLNSVIGSKNVNSFISNGSTVGAGMLAAYTLADNLEFKKPKPTTTPSPQPSTPAEPPQLVEPTQEVIPEEVVSEVTEQDFDELAREEFESQGAEAIYERRSKVIEEIEGMISSGDTEGLKEKLSEYGYSEPEIEAILENPEFVKAACIEGDQRAALTEIANRLADEAGIKDFDTKYDDGQQYQDLADGTTSSEYIANMSLDENVSQARTEYKEARIEYENAVQEANNSIAAANDAKVNMDNLKNEFGSDTTKWTQEQADRYNNAVNQYNDAVKVAAEKSAATQGPKEAYLQAKDNYNTAKEEFIDRIKNPDTSGEIEEIVQNAEAFEEVKVEYGVPYEPGNGGAQQIIPTEGIEVGTTILPNETVLVQKGEYLVGDPVELPEATILPIEKEIIGGQTSESGSTSYGASDADLLAALNITENGISFK